jgi:hypothetical protein
VFANLEKTTYKSYLDQIKSDTQDLGLILALKQFTECKNYYIAELGIAEDMLDEYRSYI